MGGENDGSAGGSGGKLLLYDQPEELETGFRVEPQQATAGCSLLRLPLPPWRKFLVQHRHLQLTVRIASTEYLSSTKCLEIRLLANPVALGHALAMEVGQHRFLRYQPTFLDVWSYNTSSFIRLSQYQCEYATKKWNPMKPHE